MGLSYNYELNYGNLRFPFCRIVPLKMILWTMVIFLCQYLIPNTVAWQQAGLRFQPHVFQKKSKDPYLALCLHILKSCVCVSDLKIIETRGVKTWTLLPGCFDFSCFQEHWREQNGNRVQCEALTTCGEAWNGHTWHHSGLSKKYSYLSFNMCFKQIYAHKCMLSWKNAMEIFFGKEEDCSA